ncbi:NAD(+) diphosphatase [Novosphingobium sp.]|uniref:NAD(+) diphosphatase n=1 Tax=Novosphingobium sp. TaxID=1874826 RepID=UPI0022BB0AD1|nr:NAD(+) diphosphatase [Novosphingobium sp.]MCZ8019838.1 NAD(+) diphosphatase [Novosphingobium sp.]MCZ8035836.1 NAD(+) diphosphatase [Novosphingobium sp.]MCZ8052713.1 NAD(+) diphosphatase [Novosphingobium sp.]MCZ8060817.1 NAD(+) diphosphatase [Novosphingobium sp.]MCZ8233389.1 NAD(+) diphosphatase [Novosphingobium sp.]
MSRPLAFAGSPIDRADHIRADPDRLAALMDWRARLLKLDGLDPVLSPEGTLEWGTLADAAPDSDLVFLGLAAGKACFAEVPARQGGSTGPANPRLWAAMAALDPGELATYGGARSLVDWHARHRFCAQCGSPTRLAKGGWQRTCTNDDCKADHFPRVDPVTIMLVEHQGNLLLGRQPRFPPRRFSALAGFVEPGESIEDAVAREIMEEAGVVVRDVTYVASQPWPFPSSLMIGCHSHADSAELTIDTTELDEARWFTRAEVELAMTGSEDAAFIAPPPHAVAHHLLKWWLEQ